MLERREKGRQRILEGAARILDGGELSDFTVDSLARSLHMSKSTLYKYFDSKDDVVVSLVEGTCNEAEAELEGIDVASSRSAADALERLVAVLARHVERTPGAILLHAGELPIHTWSRVQRLHEAFQECVEAVMTRGVETREFDVPNPHLAAAAYLAALDEAVATVARHEETLGRGDALRAIHQMIARGFAHA